jgi:hypothetical protein
MAETRTITPGRPPLHTRFQKGQSGNPGGRSKKKTTVPEWPQRLVCARCGSRTVGMAVTGTERR